MRHSHEQRRVNGDAKEGETLRMQLENHTREREILNKKITKASDRSKVTFDLIKIQENTRKNLDNEVRGFKESVHTQRDSVQQLVQDRERYEAEADAANVRRDVSAAGDGAVPIDERLHAARLQRVAVQRVGGD